jgi:hypothetical protein
MLRLIFLLLLLGPGIAFAGKNSYWLEGDKNCVDKPIGNDDKYHEDGHGDTTYVVARIAGYSRHDAERLSCFSQLPDAAALRLSAPLVGVWGFANLEYRRLIVDSLHSLHGGNSRAVTERRNRLAGLVNRGIKESTSAWKIGFIVHAMGDSYAHVSGSGDKMKAYGVVVGHIFAFGDKPDTIGHKDNIVHYVGYVRALYAALQNGSARPELLEDFIAQVTAAARDENDPGEKVVKAIKEYKVVLSPEPQNSLNPEKYEYSREKELEFLRWLRLELDAGLKKKKKTSVAKPVRVTSLEK